VSRPRSARQYRLERGEEDGEIGVVDDEWRHQVDDVGRRGAERPGARAGAGGGVARRRGAGGHLDDADGAEHADVAGVRPRAQRR